MLLDHAEPKLFEIEQELVDERGFHAAAAILGDVKDREKVRQVIEKYRPGVVFHAAAYKHVPLVEENPLEAVRNNVPRDADGGRASQSSSASKRFVLVSTDKAVEPDERDGSRRRRSGEWIVSRYGARDDVTTRFCAVRFGNVLASSRSVIPVFRRQIATAGR